jgi:aryl carrier-like protein
MQLGTNIHRWYVRFTVLHPLLFLLAWQLFDSLPRPRCVDINIFRQEHHKSSSSHMEAKLQSIWAYVLNLPHVALDQPFLAVGGDSISAMQVVGQCRKDGIGLGVQEVLRSRSIVQLVQAVTEVQHTSCDTVEYFDEEFDLTPIQSLFFQRPNEGRGHFNQSFYLQVKNRTEPEEFRSAVQQLVARHSMLRARFSHSDELGWQQRLTSTWNPREKPKLCRRSSDV